MSTSTTPQEKTITRQQLTEKLNEDLSREYQAIIAYVVYSQVLKGAAYMNIADQLAVHAKQELDHALTIARQIDYLGGTPTVQPKPVKVTEDNDEMLRADLENENETVAARPIQRPRCFARLIPHLRTRAGVRSELGG